MSLQPLTAISPIDGRYRSKVNELADYFSEAALIRYRVMVEVEYFIALCELNLPQLSEFEHGNFQKLRSIYLDFTNEEAEKVKETEKVTNHDVKAVEYFVKEAMAELKMQGFEEFVHFGLTSQDINNTAIPRLTKDAMEEVIIPELNELRKELEELSHRWKDRAMLARTHGQPASPTRLGKEIAVFSERIAKQLEQLNHIPHSGKFGGATGNFNAHHAAYPNIDWVEFANNFLKEKLMLDRSQTTTQIEHYDNMAALFDACKRINSIIIDLNRDMWMYISMDYFKQRIKEGEVGSSAMPHKVNPIDFENSEGNLGIANSVFEHLAAKLPVSRLQRDLTDSTVLRNAGVPFAHMLLAIKATRKGLSKLLLNEEKLNRDLEENWAVVAEAIQTVLRRENYPKPYEALKGLTRKNTRITEKDISEFIDQLDIKDEVKSELKAIRPENYTGL